MITGSAFSAFRSFALCTAPVSLPIEGPLPPACEVEKNTGSTWSKSRSSRMRCTSTEPTIPRHPTIPTCSMNVVYCLKSGKHRIRHLGGAYFARPCCMNVSGAQALAQDFCHTFLDPLCRLGCLQRVAQHHRRRQD